MTTATVRTDVNLGGLMPRITITPTDNPYDRTIHHWSLNGVLVGTVAEASTGRWVALVEDWSSIRGTGPTPEAAVDSAIQAWKTGR